ncbi:class I SAM-dependent methyltransferase [Haloarchaeobius litoreus]|uniref:Class I SAM-dependent methyltransferase n=1 Tax=Haloarchaeobius litoreus TaxID=755306 RepID=A0ABD6DKZ3_9EURY|nr:class I SAM-dependent methyltransferase [Haloarchaeobius litoreus]
MVADALGTAMRDFQRGELGDCRYVDGEDRMDGHIAENYFGRYEEWDDTQRARLAELDGPVLDLGCGAGQHVRFFEDRGTEVLGVDVSPGAIEAARERGVENVAVADMFDLPFERDRFRSVLLNGTQAGLAQSTAGVRSLLSDLAHVTDAGATAQVDNYDPELVDDLFGYRPDPRDGFAHRTFHFEYEPRDGDQILGRALHFLLFSPDRLRDICVGTPWSVVDVEHHHEVYYEARLAK